MRFCVPKILGLLRDVGRIFLTYILIYQQIFLGVVWAHEGLGAIQADLQEARLQGGSYVSKPFPHSTISLSKESAKLREEFKDCDWVFRESQDQLQTFYRWKGKVYQFDPLPEGAEWQDEGFTVEESKVDVMITPIHEDEPLILPTPIADPQSTIIETPIYDGPDSSILLKEKELLPGEGKVGTYGELHNLRIKGDNLTPNHIPQDAYMRQHGIKTNDGIAMMMEQPTPGKGGRHRQTRTYGKQTELRAAPRTVLARDIQDLRQIYKKDDVYTPEIKQGLQDVIQKNKEKFPDLFKKATGE